MNTPINLIHPRDEIMQTMERIYRYRMTTTSGGNLSIREDDGRIWITPARVDKGGLRREDIVCVHPDGTVEGLHKPSSEFPFHRAIYAALNAGLQMEALRLGEVTFLDPLEAAKAAAANDQVIERPWVLWRRQAMG